MPAKTSSSYFSVGYNFSQYNYATGDIITTTDDIKEENIIRIKSTGVDGDYVVEAKMLGETSFSPIFVGTGTIDTTLDIGLVDRIRIRCSSNLSTGFLAVSSFLSYGDVTATINGGTATSDNQIIGNTLLSNINDKLDSQATEVLQEQILEKLSYTYTILNSETIDLTSAGNFDLNVPLEAVGGFLQVLDHKVNFTFFPELPLVNDPYLLNKDDIAYLGQLPQTNNTGTPEELTKLRLCAAGTGATAKVKITYYGVI